MTYELLQAWTPFLGLVAVWIALAIFVRKWRGNVTEPKPEAVRGPKDCTTLARHADQTNILRRYKVLVDGELVGMIRAGEIMSFPVNPGEHNVVVKVDWCASRPLSITKAPRANLSLWCGATYNDSRCMFMGYLKPREYVYVRTDA